MKISSSKLLNSIDYMAANLRDQHNWILDAKNQMCPRYVKQVVSSYQHCSWTDTRLLTRNSYHLYIFQLKFLMKNVTES